MNAAAWLKEVDEGMEAYDQMAVAIERAKHRQNYINELLLRLEEMEETK